MRTWELTGIFFTKTFHGTVPLYLVLYFRMSLSKDVGQNLIRSIVNNIFSFHNQNDIKHLTR